MTLFVSAVIITVIVLLDQLIKHWAFTVLAPVQSMIVIPGFLRLTYVENQGAAFGIFFGQRWLLTVLVAVILIICCYLLYSKRIARSIERFCITLIIGGGAGNLIDRIMRGFVVDYIDINDLFQYPMFNLADCCVVAGAILMVLAAFFENKTKTQNMKEMSS